MEPKDKDFSKFYHEIVKSELLAELSSSAVRVYLVILVYAHYNTGWSYPSVKTLSRLSGVNKNLISRAIRELEHVGFIRKSKIRKKSYFRNGYQVIPHPAIFPHLLPVKIKKRKSPLKGKDGRFKSVPSNMDNDIPLNMDTPVPSFVDSDTCPHLVDNK
jgi:DNA-binding transcriptional MocR family regulator